MDSKQSLVLKKNNRDSTSVSSLQEHEYAAAFDGKNKLKKQEKQLTVKGIAMPRVCALEKLNVLAFYSLYYTDSKNTIGSVL
jgi:hypothetical protein